MIFDRISLVKAYAGLKIVQLNDGAIKDILFNKTAHYGTKTILRFKTLADLAAFINENYPYQYFDINCQCGITQNEAIWRPLSFNLTLPNNRYATFVNNLRGDFESAQEADLNKLSVDACKAIFKTEAQLTRLKGTYACMEYIQNQNLYVDPCNYVEIIRNDAYFELMQKLYPLSKHPDITATQLFEMPEPFEVAQVPIPELNITTTTTTTTTTAAPTTTTTTTAAPTTTTTTTTVAPVAPTTTTTTTAAANSPGPSNLVHATQNYIDANGNQSSYWDYNAVDANGDFVHDNAAIVNSYENPALGNMNGGQDQRLRSATGINGNFNVGDDIERWYPSSGWTSMSSWVMGPQYRGVYEDTTGKYSSANENWIVRVDNTGVLVEFIPFSQVVTTTTTTTTTTAAPSSQTGPSSY